MNKYLLTAKLFCILCISCNFKESTEKVLNVPLDTMEIIREANIVESVSKIPDSLFGKLETKSLAYIAFACDCPNYVNLSSKDSIGQFREAFYIEPAAHELMIPEILRYSSNEFELTGVITQAHGLPNYGFMDPHPQPGPVFTYWSYKIKYPYKFYGPQFKIIDLLGDTVELASKITVK